jgi:hypothetical protein
MRKGSTSCFICRCAIVLGLVMLFTYRTCDAFSRWAQETGVYLLCHPQVGVARRMWESLCRDSTPRNERLSYT